jgi:hypothetical protein
LKQGFVEHITRDGDMNEKLIAVIYLKCNPGQVKDSEWPTVDAGYKKLSGALGLSDADWADVVEWSKAQQYERQSHSFKLEDPSKAWSQLDPVEQFGMIQKPVYGKGAVTDEAYATDALGANLSEAGRLSFITQCVNDTKPVEMAMCQPDIDAFDAKKLAGEIRGKGNGFQRMTIRIVAAELGPVLATRAEAVKKLQAKDPAYPKLFELAKQAHAEWATRSKSGGDALAAIAAMDDAFVSGSRRAAEGCSAKAWSALKSAVAKIPAKQFAPHTQDAEDIHPVRDAMVNAIIHDVDGYLAGTAYAECDYLIDHKAGAPDDALANDLKAGLAMWPGFRGPRTTSWTRIMTTDIQLDNRDDKLEFPAAKRGWFSNRSMNTAGGVLGTVASTKADGENVTITFAKKAVKKTVDTGCKQTHRLESIRPDGVLVYAIDCTGSKEVTINSGPAPSVVAAKTADGLKAGMYVAVGGNMMVMAWSDPKTKVPKLVLGQPVK